MGVSRFCAGTTVRVGQEKFLIRRELEQGIWQLENSRTLRIVEWSLLDLQRAYVDGVLTFEPVAVEGVRQGLPDVTQVPHEDYEKAKCRRLFVLAVLERPVRRTVFEEAIQKVWQQHRGVCEAQLGKEPSFSAVARWRKRYIAAAGHLSSLCDRTANKGNRTPRYSEEVTKLVERAIDEVYLTRPSGSATDVLRHAQALVNRENTLRPSGAALPLPGVSLVKRMIGDLPAFDASVARDGANAARVKFRGVLNVDKPKRLLEKASIDHTKLDLFVLDNQFSPLGRPWLTVCVEDYSRCLLGMHLGFQPPSFLTLARCLKHALLPKTYMQQERFKEVEHPWEAHGRMSSILMDNAFESHGNQFERACEQLAIAQIFSGSRTPWHKPHVERFLGTVNIGLIHRLPGTTFASILARGDYDPERMAVITWDLLVLLVHKWACDVYHEEWHRGLKTSPMEFWRAHVRQEDLELPDDPRILDIVLGRIERRRLTHAGVTLNGLTYNSTQLIELRKRFGAVLDIEVAIDDGDLGYVTVLGPDGTAPVRVPCLNSEYASGLTAFQHRVYQRYAAEQKKDRQSIPALLEARMRIRELAAEALGRRGGRGSGRLARFVEELSPATDVEGDGEDSAPTVRNSGEASREALPGAETAKRFDPIIGPWERDE